MSGRDTYLGRDYGSHAQQTRELEERRGYREPDERAVAWEEDLQDDLAAERRGIKPKLSMTTNSTRTGMPITIRWDHGMGGYRVDAPNFAETGPVQVFTAEEIRAALQRTDSHFAGDHVNAGVAVGRVYVELGLESAA